ncbi:MAG: arsenate reductase ArsC [Rhodothermia bacterium]
MPKQSVLFICTHNSARSQMAEGLLRANLGDRYEAYSAGTEADRVKPLAIRAMAELGIDISGHRSKTVDEFFGRKIDYVVTVCDSAREACPYFPARIEVMYKNFEDPSDANGTEEQRLSAFRATRDEIRSWILDEFGE